LAVRGSAVVALVLASKPAPFQSDLVKAIRRACGWPRRDLTGASVFVVCGEIDFVEFCLSQASRLELGKARKRARLGVGALASGGLCLVHAHSCCKYLRPRRGALQQHVECSPHLSSPASLERQMRPDTFAVLSRTFVAQLLLEHSIILFHYRTCRNGPNLLTQ
jgi:hypothetical protein